MEDMAKLYGLASNYLSRGRLASYAHQLAAVLELRPNSVLEVGKGPGLVSGGLRAVGVKVTTLDMRPQLQPDLVGSVVEIPAEAQQFDVALCCQVLEHLPFTEFRRACQELRRVSRRALILSLPDITKHYFVHLRLPVVKNVTFGCSIPRLKRPPQKVGPVTKGHWWEIGFRGASLADVKRELRASGWKLERTWRVPENAWHRFFLLKPESDGKSTDAS
jgi:ubiquinone/menaquinone biosynthesis C-methylase UbiE